MWELPALFFKMFYKILDIIRGEVYRRKAEVYKYQVYLEILLTLLNTLNPNPHT